MTTDAELTYDGLDLLGGGDSPYHVFADGMSLGSAERVIEAFARMLFDGEDMRLRRRSNRSLPFTVEITADDPLALAEAGARLELAADKPRTTLRWKPPGMNTPVSVFQTFPALKIEQVFDDLDEMRNKRRYALTIPAKPFAYSATPVTVDVPAGGSPSLTLVDGMSSASGWSGRDGVTVSVAGGTQLRAESTAAYTTTIQFDGPSRTVSDYVAVDMYAAHSSAVFLIADGVSFPPIGAEQLPTNGWQRVWFRPGAGTKTLGIRATASSNLSLVTVDEINTTTVPPAGLPRMVPVLGSAPSEVSLRVTLGGSTTCVIAGGPRLAYYKPMVLSATFASDTAQFGGPGGGAYALISTLGGTVSAGTATGSDGQAAPFQGASGTVQSLGTFFVPAGRAGAPSPYTVTFGGTTASATVWALPVDDDHAFAIFTGLTGAYLFLEPPTLDNPHGGAWEGTAADGSDAVPVLSKAQRFRLPQLAPAQTSLYVYPETAALQLTYTPAWGANAGL